ncbi:MAG: aconitate hydratase AcnA [Planctomycetia bacterium]|nr:MAG: aconitate hydratase AcnA [Planctomycetia bacterium]
MTAKTESFGARSTLKTRLGEYEMFRLDALARQGIAKIERLPYSIRVLLESVLRNVDGFAVLDEHVRMLAGWDPAKPGDREVPFKPARVVLQDFTGVPCIVDLAAMRDAMKHLGGDPARINPEVPCDLVIDHSVQVDEYGSRTALSVNSDREFRRNRERYEFLKWGQQSLSNFRVVPPATGIVHQVNLEYLARGVLTRDVGGKRVAFPDTLVGTDSHTTMINGLGVLGWGVGGIEAEAAMLGQPLYMLAPEVIGFRLTGRLPEGATATDLVLTVTQMLRKHGVVDKFVEFFGDGLDELSIPDRATIANMAPEYGATMGFFPVDTVTLDYLRFTGRDAETLALVEAYCKENGLFRTAASPEPIFTATLALDLGSVQPSLAGPKRPQDRVLLSGMKAAWERELTESFGKQPRSAELEQARLVSEGGHTTTATATSRASATAVQVNFKGDSFPLRHGDVVISAITSCTNTSNPDVMIAAGLLARAARQRGLTSKPWVKTSLAPGSQVVTEYYNKAGLTEDLEALGFHTVGYGCTTCIGNSGPLPSEIESAIKEGDLVVASVLSGNRNFEGRVHPQVRANYLASPPLCVAYAIAGTVNIDLTREPIGRGSDGRDVFLRDLWPTQAQIRAVREQAVTPEQFSRKYQDVFNGNATWNAVPISKSELYAWSDRSTYIQNPPFFEGMGRSAPGVAPIRAARCLVSVGDSVTTDHISPAGDIAENSPAGQFLMQHGVSKADFNSYGSRRGNDRVMTRGTYANVRVKNKLAVDPATGSIREGGWTRDFSAKGGGKLAWIFDASTHYREAGTPLIVLAGKDYGMGSSRDWAAKGVFLLGVKAVIAESFERIHRSNLVGMGVLPLVYVDGQNAASLGLTGEETFDFPDLSNDLKPGQTLTVTARGPAAGREVKFSVRSRIATAVEVEYYRNGGVLHTVIRGKLGK